VIAMPISSRTFWLARRGNSLAEYEDAWAADEAAGRYAVADGASESCFAGPWARLLVEGFVGDCPNFSGTVRDHAAHGARVGESGTVPFSDAEADRWLASLPALQEQWNSAVRGRALPWYAQLGVEQGAFATFLGLVLTNSPLPPGEGPGVMASYHWQATAVGDTCLVHTRGGALLRAFPLEHSTQFDNVPKLVGSRMAAREIHKRQRFWADGRGQPGDRLWTMTDALAQCCLAEHEAGGNPWDEMESFLSSFEGTGTGPESQRAAAPDAASGEAPASAVSRPLCMPEAGNSFAAWIEGLRDAGRLRNDDVTLLAIRL
jgi:hypothetical protein